MTWAEVIRKLKAAGFVEVRSGKGSHLLLKHPKSGKEVRVAVHTKLGGTYALQYRYDGGSILMLPVFHGHEAR